MKEAFWALGLMVLGIFGLVLVNLFGDITTTNQQNYTLMKNSVEAAMYDSIDFASFSTGFCLCNKSGKKSNGKWVFTSSSQYDIKEPTDIKTCNYSGYESCEFMRAEYKIDKDVFAESLVRRFANTAKSTKSYRIVIQDVIEYPPKVSVVISSANSYNIFEEEINENSFDIINRMDSILEDKTEPLVEPEEPEEEPLIPVEDDPTPPGGGTSKPPARVQQSSCHYYAEGTYGKKENTYYSKKIFVCRATNPITKRCSFWTFENDPDSAYKLVRQYNVSKKTAGTFTSKSSAVTACYNMYASDGYNKGNNCTAYTIYRWSFNGSSNGTNYSSSSSAVSACQEAHKGEKGTCNAHCV